MKILISLRSYILAEGVKRIISENFADATMADYCTNPPMDNPDLVLFDSRDFISDLMQKYAQAKFIYFDLGVKPSELACLLYCHGINGVISADQDVDMFCKALRSVKQGEIWLEQKHLKSLLREGRSNPAKSGINCLSDQDKQIVLMVTQGLKNQEIADRLLRSLPTIKAHLSRIYKTLHIGNRSQLVALSTESSWLSPANVTNPSDHSNTL